MRPSSELAERIEALKQFWFLVDSPLYIDDSLVEGLFDAIVRPEYEASSRQLASSKSYETEKALETAVAGEAAVPTIFKLSATGKVSGRQKSGDSSGETRVELAINSAPRRLERLVNLYVYSYPDRALCVKPDLVTVSNLLSPQQDFDWDNVERLFDTSAIRPIVFLDLNKGTKLLPMFAELTDGQPLKLFEKFLEKLGPELSKQVPGYPRDEEPQEHQKAYWDAFESVFSSGLAMGVIEEAARNSNNARIDWIDYRLVGRTKNGGVVPLHLHLTPRGRYAAGTFAYQFVRRGFKFGHRIIGTLKRGYDINVLAVYER